MNHRVCLLSNYVCVDTYKANYLTRNRDPIDTKKCKLYILEYKKSTSTSIIFRQYEENNTSRSIIWVYDIVGIKDFNRDIGL